VEIAHEEPKPVLPVRTAASPSLGVDEEVKIPSWLAPLSQSPDTPVAEPTDSTEASIGQPVSVNSEESYDALVAGGPHRSHSAVFGGQLLGESAAPASEVTPTGSKKSLFLGLAAAALLALGGGAWYFQQTHSGPATVAAARSTGVPLSSQLAPASNSPAAPALSTSARTNVNSTAAPSSLAPKNSAPVPIPAAAAQPKNSKPASKDPEPAEAETKPSLGDVRLAAPVVNHSSGASQDSDTLQSIDTKTVPGDGDPLATAAARHNPPAAPLPIGGEVQQAQLLKSVPPQYPPIAKAQHLSGKVQIDALIDASGNVASVKVLSGPTLLHQAALDSVKQWKYSPAMLDGQPTTMHLTVTVEFRNQ
jgi:TonB family protein